MQQFVLVLVAGALYTLGDIVAREWGRSPTVASFLLMGVVASCAYSVFGYLSRENEFSQVAIWVSISLTTFSCLYGIVRLGDTLSWSRVVAMLLALGAAYLSTRTDW